MVTLIPKVNWLLGVQHYLPGAPNMCWFGLYSKREVDHWCGRPSKDGTNKCSIRCYFLRCFDSGKVVRDKRSTATESDWQIHQLHLQFVVTLIPRVNWLLKIQHHCPGEPNSCRFGCWHCIVIDESCIKTARMCRKCSLMKSTARSPICHQRNSFHWLWTRGQHLSTWCGSHRDKLVDTIIV